MSKLASKLSKRIMASVLSVAMVMSNMTVYASELGGPQVEKSVDESAAMTEESSVTLDDAATSDESSEAAGVVDETTVDTPADETPDEPVGDVTDDDGQTTGGDEASEPVEDADEDLSLEIEEEVKDEGEVEPVDELVDESAPLYSYDSTKKVDVWDFGAADLGNDVNNMLTATNYAEVTKSWHAENVEAGNIYLRESYQGLNADAESDSDLRIVTANSKIALYLNSSNSFTKTGFIYNNYNGTSFAKTNNGNTYNGALYYNASGTGAWLEIDAEKGDKITVAASTWNSNTNGYTIAFCSAEDNITEDSSNNTRTLTVPDDAQKIKISSDIEELDFYAPAGGTYVICATDAKLVVARITREHTDTVAVSGTVTFADGTDTPNAGQLANEALVFTDDATGEEVTADIEATTANDTTTYSYKIEAAPDTGVEEGSSYIYNKHSYTVSLKEGSAYTLSEEVALDLTANGDAEADLTKSNVNITLKTASKKAAVSGTITVGGENNNVEAVVQAITKVIFEPVVTEGQESTAKAVEATLEKSNNVPTGKYTASLELATPYTVVVESTVVASGANKGDGIKNYVLDTTGDGFTNGVINIADTDTTSKVDVEKTIDLKYGPAETYSVSINLPDDIDADALKDAKIIFTDKDDENYKFEFDLTQVAATDDDQQEAQALSSVLSAALSALNDTASVDAAVEANNAIELRKGTYSVKVTKSGEYIQDATDDLTISEESQTPVGLNIPFSSVYAEKNNNWDFNGFTDDDAKTYKYYKGLIFDGAVSSNKTYALLGQNGIINVPVSGNCTVSVKTFYSGAGTIGGAVDDGGTALEIGNVVDYKYVGEKGTVEIKASQNNTYIETISVVYPPAAGGEIPTSWDFSDTDWTSSTASTPGSWKSLVFKNVTNECNISKPHAQMANGSTIQIPVDVTKNWLVKVSYYYSANAKFERETTNRISTSSGSTTTTEYKYLASDSESLINVGYVTITADATTYIKKIEVVDLSTDAVTVSGTVTFPADAAPADTALADMNVVFKDDISTVKAPITKAEDGTYKYEVVYTENSTEYLYKHAYEVSIEAEGYILPADSRQLDLSKDGAVTENAAAFNISLLVAPRVSNLSGAITVTNEAGAADVDVIDKLVITFKPTADFANSDPKTATINKTDTSAVTYTAELDDDVTYDIVITGEGSKEYELNNPESTISPVSINEDKADHDLSYVLKPRYAVNVNTTGATLEDLAKTDAVITFTDVDDPEYKYSYNVSDLTAPASTALGSTLAAALSDAIAVVSGDENGNANANAVIKLRNGTYSVAVTNSGSYVQGTTENLVVNGVAVDLTIAFTLATDLTLWDFSSEDWINGEQYPASWRGLVLDKVKNEQNLGKKHAILETNSTIKVPVKSDWEFRMAVTYYYAANAKFENEEENSIVATADPGSLGSTNRTETATFHHADDDELINPGYVTITGAGTTYITKIQIMYVEPEEEIEYDSSKIDLYDFGGGVIAHEVDVTNDDGTAGKQIQLKMEGEGEAAKKVYFDSNVYKNMLTENILNSLYDSSVEVGSEGKNIASFAIDREGNPVAGAIDAETGQVTNFKDVAFCFNDNGNHKTHRLRSINTALTRYDTNSRTLKAGDDDGQGNNIAAGYIYSNSSATENVYLGIRLGKGDILDAIVSSNGGAYTVVVEAPNGDKQEFEKDAGVSTIKAYATRSGMYKIYYSTEKLVVGRITVQHTDKVAVSGAVTLPEGVDDLSLVFTCVETGAKTTAPVEISGTAGTYSIELQNNYHYTVAPSNTRLVVSEGAELALAKGAEATTHNVVIGKVPLHELTGSIIGIDDDIDSLVIELEKPEDKLYVPIVTIDAAAKTYSAELEQGVEYTIVSKDKGTGKNKTRVINDYQLDSSVEGNTGTVKLEQAGTRDITYTKKPVYEITLVAKSGETDVTSALAEADVTFTNLGLREGCEDDADYVYTFKLGDKIELRDGVYAIELANIGAYVQKLTANLVVDGAAVTHNVPVVPANEITLWDFSDSDFTGAAKTDIANGWKGLKFTGNVSNETGKGHALLKEAGTTVQVPVKTDKKYNLTVTYYYTADAKFESETTSAIATESKSTSKYETETYSFDQDTVLLNNGYVTITNVSGTTYLTKIQVMPAISYSETITVGTDKNYKTINEALDAVRAMDRAGENGAVKPVTISIDPGNYEEMLVIDTPNVKLVNAAGANASIALKDKGVNIDANAVRITSYYGHGYTYYSMGSDCKWNEELLAYNKANGYPSFKNPGTGTTSGSYWNATVVITASNVSAEGIIFENSFNQYVSAKAADDVIVAQVGAAKEGEVPRAELKTVGDTTVQQKEYVERAAALAITNNCAQVSFDNCKFIGRQDTLYGGTSTTASFYKCSVYGGTDYIFGPMTAVFAKCDLVFNTNDETSKGEKDDVGYITAPQQSSGRGYLMYNCHVTSTVPGVDTSSLHPSKPGYFGRPWQAATGEAVFYNTIIDATDSYWYESKGASLITPAGWLSSLGGESKYSQEYGTFEYAKGVDNSARRASWSSVLTEPTLVDLTEGDNTPISVAAFLGEWNPFDGKDMEIVMPKESDKVDNNPNAAGDDVKVTTYVLDIGEEYPTVTENTNLDVGGSRVGGTDKFFTIYFRSEANGNSRIEPSVRDFGEYQSTHAINMQQGAKVSADGVPSGAVGFTTTAASKVKVYWSSAGSSARTITILNDKGETVHKGDDVETTSEYYQNTFELAEAGTYYLGGTNGVRIFRVEVSFEVKVKYVESTYTLDIGEEYPTVTENTNLDVGGSRVGGTDKFFTIYFRSEANGNSRIEPSVRDFPDGYKSTHAINMQQGAKVVDGVPSGAVGFTTTSEAKVKVYWSSAGSSARTITILNDKGETVQKGEDVTSTSEYYQNTFELAEAGTYYLGGTNGVRIFKVEVTSRVAMEYEEKDLILDIGEEYPTVTENTNLDVGGSRVGGTDKFFTIYFRSEANGNSRIEPSVRDFPDGYQSTHAINMQQGAKVSADGVPSGAIGFTTTSEAKVKVYWSSAGSSARTITILNDKGETVHKGEDVTSTSEYYQNSFDLPDAGTYYLGGTNGVRIFRVEVKTTVYKTGEVEKPDWADVPAPVITKVENSGTDALKISITANVVDNKTYKLLVSSIDEDGSAVVIKTIDEETTEHTVTFTPTASGIYRFKATLQYTSKVVDADGNDVLDEYGNVTYKTETKESAVYPEEGIFFLLPFGVPSIRSTTDKGVDEETGSAKVEVAWDPVDEATSYLVKATEKGADTTTTQNQPYEVDGEETSFIVGEGLTVGKTYVFEVAAVRAGTGEGGADEISVYDSAEHTATGENNTTWAFAVYGPSAKKSNNNYSDETVTNKYPTDTGVEKPINKEAGDQVRVWSIGNSSGGKIQPTSIDGLAFYYTTINPKTTNFKLSATAYVNEWTYSNGQDGFGVMAADRVITLSEDNDVWNNSYQAVVSKVEYRWDAENNKAAYDDDLEKRRYSMRLGIGSTEKKGVTASNLDEFAANSSEAQGKYFKADTKTLETSMGKNGMLAGNYNIIDGYTGNAPEGTQPDYLLRQMRLTVELNNTGYFVSYTPVDQTTGEPLEDQTTTIKYYDRDALSQIDKNHVYAGFFASRNADISFRDISFTTSDPATDAPAEEQPTETLLHSYGITSGSTANKAEYQMLFGANWPGWLTIKDSKGSVIVNNAKINTSDARGNIETYKVPDLVNLSVGTNTFQWTYTPDEAYNPEDPESYYNDNNGIENPAGAEPIRQITYLDDYSAQTDTFTVTYKAYGEEGTALYVSPTGSALGTGTKANPLDIYTAVKYVQPGQTIYLMKGKNNGVYNLGKAVTIDRGVSGTADKPIRMMPEPNADGSDAARSVVLNYGRSSEGIVLAGDYWYLYGFDITKSALGSDGMRVCGSNNIVDSVYTYDNGNTGIQISRYKGSDTWDFWPSYNTIKNCTSYLNADQGFEDADGFAAKLTIGEGNVFDGCISAYNADDGWDLYAKTDTGSIGSVTIKNSLAYRNGYVYIEDTDGDGKISHEEATSAARVLSFNGIETPAGNGNGFKMGGSSVPSTGNGHQLISSIAFRNRQKGIDSNSGPNIKVTNSVSFNNESYNVAFYTNSAPSTDFAANGVISFRTNDEFEVWGTDDNNNPIITGKRPYTDFEDNHDERFIFKGAQENNDNAVKNNSNYYFDVETRTSHNKAGETVNASWFVDVNYLAFEAAMRADIVGYPRNADGSINMHGFLMLADESKRNDYMGGTPSDNPYDNIVPPTSGDVSTGDSANETESGVRPEDMDKYSELLKDSADGKLGLWFNVAYAEDVFYTGKAIRPEVHVYDDKTLLTKKDYSITFKNNLKACVVDEDDELYADYSKVAANKRPSITVKGKRNYVGQAAIQYFSIYPVDLDDDLYVAARDIAAVTGKETKISPVVTFNGKKLGKNDYTFGVAVEKTTEVDVTDENGNPVLDADGNPVKETVVETTIDKNKTKANADCKVVIEAVKGGNFTGSTTINFRVVDKSKFASNFKVAKIPEQYRLGYEDYEETIPKRVEPTLEVSQKNGGKLTLADTDEEGNLVLDEEGKPTGDYIVTYRNNVEIGTATAIITGVGEYAGTKEVKFRIVAPRINTLMTPRNQVLKIYATTTTTTKDEEGNSVPTKVTDPSKELDFKTLTYEYEGKPVKIEGLGVSKKTTVTTVDETGKEVTKEAWEPLEVDKDYTVTYRNNSRAGSASVVIKGKGNYSGSIAKTFKITALDLAKAEQHDKTIKLDEEGKETESRILGGTFDKDYELKAYYEKGSSRPEVVLLVNGNKMRQGKDYTVTYKNNTLNTVSGNTNSNKKPTIIVTGKGGLKGKLTKEFTIDRKSLSDPDMMIMADDVTISAKATVSGNSTANAYKGKLTPRIVIKDANGKVLSPGADYDKDSITYELISGNGSISGKGTVKADGTIDTSKAAPTATINSASDVLTIKATVKAYAAGNKKFAKCNYSDEISVTYRVSYAKASIKSARVTINYNNGNKKYFDYTGEEIRLNQNGVTTDLTVIVNGKPLEYGTDYEIVTRPIDSYLKNINKGTASLTIRGKGEYAGTKIVKFRIGPKQFIWGK